jgi:hypothetical protein
MVINFFSAPKLILLFFSVSVLAGCKKKEKEEAPHPVISFSHSAPNGAVPDTITFTASIKNSSTVSWNFGDGQSGTGLSVKHIYSHMGFFEVTASTTSDAGVTASETDFVNISPYASMHIEQVNMSVGAKPGGGTWDANVPPDSNPDLICEIYSASGEKLTGSTSLYSPNTFSSSVSTSGVVVTEFNKKFTVKILDYDLGGPNEYIATISFRPGDYFSTAIPFITSFSKDDGAGNSAGLIVTWN